LKGKAKRDVAPLLLSGEELYDVSLAIWGHCIWF
jgi:hypothetical protein